MTEAEIFYQIQGHLRERRSSEALKLLKENKEQIGIHDVSYTNHLHTAVSQNLADVTKYLLSQKCDVNFADLKGNTALIMVMEKRPFPNDAWYIEYLASYGAKFSHKNKAGLNALAIYAKQRPDERIRHCIQTVIATCNIDDQSLAAVLCDAGWLIYHVIKFRRPEVISLMIEMGARVNARESIMNDTALHLAVLLNDIECVNRLLFKHGADVNLRNRYGVSPLTCAFLNNRHESHLEVVQALLRRRPECFASEVFYAFWYSSARMVNLLLNNVEFDLTMINQEGESLLHFAACNPDLEVMNILVRSNAVIDWDQRTHSQKNALHCAAASGNVDVIDFLIKKGTKVQGKDQQGRQPLIYAISSSMDNDIDISQKKRLLHTFELLLDHGSDVDAIVYDEKGGFIGTPLYCTCRLDDDDMTHLLLQKIALREFMGIPMSECNKRKIYSKESAALDAYITLCKIELKTMDDCEVGVLNGTTKDIHGWIRDKYIREAISKRFNEFSIYGKQLNKRFWKMNNEAPIEATSVLSTSNQEMNLMDDDNLLDIIYNAIKV